MRRVESQDGYVEVNGVRLHYRRAGDGPLMLFLHGFPEFWFCWRSQLAHFGADHLALAPDLRGYNLSDHPPDPASYRPKLLVEDIRQLAAAFSQEPFVLVAHDWGGALAWAFALAYPDRLSKLVIINAPHPYCFWRELAANPAQQQASEYMLRLREPSAEQSFSADGYARLLEMRFGADCGAANAERRDAYLAAWSQPGALAASLNYYRASPLYPPNPGDAGAAKLALRPEDFVVRVPTLVLWGERDRALLPGLLDGIGALVPDLEIVRLPEATHWVMDEQPERVNREIRRFLDKEEK